MGNLNNIMTRSFTGSNLITISLVEDNEAKEYQNRYYLFLKGVPGVRDESKASGRTYDTQSGITFKLEAEKGLAISFALKQYAGGKGQPYEQAFGPYLMFADSSKSQYGGGGKKSFKITMGTDNKSQKAVVNLFFGSEGGKSIGVFMSPYEAFAIGEVIEFLSRRCLELEINGQGAVVKKPSRQSFNNTESVSPLTQQFTPPPPRQQAPSNQSGINTVTNDFSNMFNDNPFS